MRLLRASSAMILLATYSAAIGACGRMGRVTLEAFEKLEHDARQAILDAGGCLSHHHGIGKHRAPMLPQTQAPELTSVMHGMKAAMDPDNVLGARNGIWSDVGTTNHQMSTCERQPGTSDVTITPKVVGGASMNTGLGAPSQAFMS